MFNAKVYSLNKRKEKTTTMKKSRLMLIALLSSSLVLSACFNKAKSNSSGGADGGENEPNHKYTNHGWATSLGTKWDPNTWETSGDSSLLEYVSEGLVSIAPLDTEKQTWQWTYDSALEVTDVSESVKNEFAKYHISYTEPAEGQRLTGYAYDIKLNPNATWEKKTINGKEYGGTKITADDYVESFKILLDPARKNYRANLYYSGESAVAGGNQYYNNDEERVYNLESFDSYEAAMAATADKDLYIDAWELWGAQGFTDAAENGNECPQWVKITDETIYGNEVYWADPTNEEAEGYDVCSGEYILYIYNAMGYFDYISIYSIVDNWGYQLPYEQVVGMYKVDDYTIRYFLETPNDINNFKTHLTSSWLVHPQLYKDLSHTDDSTGALVSDYNTSAENTLSYGPYKMVSFEDGKQVKFTQNEYWYGWERKANGDLVSTTNFLVDGKKQPQYQTTDVVIDVMKQEAAKLAFEKGELNDYTPTADELGDYLLSSQLYQVDESYTMSFFFDTNLDDLKKMDADNTNQNGVVLSNRNFRKAFSLAIDRADWVKTTEGYKPAYSIFNSLYYYDIFNNPDSQYRKTDAAMKAIVDLYGVEYGAGKTYATLKEAYDSITGYNLNEAKSLMKTACDELVAEDLYTAGDEIKIKIAYKKGALESSDLSQVAAMNKYLEAAREGSGFGKITLEAVGNLTDRYANVGQDGIYAIGYGAWGGATFYPFRGMGVYMDPDKNELHEGRCWDPKTETFTINVNGTDVTMTYQQWANSMVGNGPFADADAETKLNILAALESDYLGKYYRIPLAGSTACFLLGYQQHYYTDEYHVMYGFGGGRLMIYDYDDAEWAAFVAEQGGKLNYK